MTTPEDRIAAMAKSARAAAAEFARVEPAQTADALRASAAAVRDGASAILAANEEDLARAHGLSPAMQDRLRLDAARVEGIAAALDGIAALPSPLGEVIDTRTRPNGLRIERVRVPIGVIGIVY
jgi:glutamate-5-semialdehyde dehydrogenase